MLAGAATTEAGAGRERVPALDGLRGIAILAVLGLHLRIPGFAGGARGVDVFFVLSGFLITAILLASPVRSRGGTLRHFYGRRLRRIVPALVVLLAFHVALGFAQARTGTRLLSNGEVGETGRYAREAALALTFGTFSVTSLRLLDLGGLTYTWSLAVEEQFYLVYPVVFLLAARLRSTRMLAVLLAAVVVAVHVQRTLLVQRYAGQLGPGQLGYFRLAFHPDVRLDGVAMGCLAALAWARWGAAVREREPLRTLVVVAGLVGAAFLAWVITAPTGADMRFLVRVGYVATSGATVLVVLAAVAGAPLLDRTLSSRPLRWLGHRSYGLYLWHIPLLYALRPVLPGALHVTGVALATLAVAELSYRFVEQPFLRTSSSGSAPSAAPTAVVAASECPSGTRCASRGDGWAAPWPTAGGGGRRRRPGPPPSGASR